MAVKTKYPPPPVLVWNEEQLVGATLLTKQLGHRVGCLQRHCELCSSIYRLRSRVHPQRIRIVAIAIADRLGLGHD